MAYFTKDDYLKILQWLNANAIKDTDFNEAELPFRGNETIAFVQNGKNVKVSIKDLMSQLSSIGLSDVVNIDSITGLSLLSLEEAIRLVPYKARKEGQIITFTDETGEWKLYQFTGVLNQWNIAQLWKELLSGGGGEPIIPPLDYRIYSEEDYDLFDQLVKMIIIEENVPEILNMINPV